MGELFESLNRYWAVLSGCMGFVCSVCFLIGKLWEKAQSNHSAINKLFAVYDEMQTFKRVQAEKNVIFERDIQRNHDSFNKRLDEMKEAIDINFKLLLERTAKNA